MRNIGPMSDTLAIGKTIGIRVQADRGDVAEVGGSTNMPSSIDHARGEPTNWGNLTRNMMSFICSTSPAAKDWESFLPNSGILGSQVEHPRSLLGSSRSSGSRLE
ncbi:hypothetical protein KPH14_010421 [Odynerus spinipes]|uniref:Uncharacterized protein n=1 Tax=Odynerus spinipes TaxID=1348599 RepID=A0AAD9VSZ2_9HYME|nr:hypothetical protein KPH14_010421 [Odynerus spinipes]